MEFRIGSRLIGADTPPYVIAEMSGNHNGEISRAYKIMEAAKAAGADAVKLQTYTADTITIDHDSADFKILSGPWAGRTLHDLYNEAHTPWEWHEDLFAHGRKLGLTVFSTPFDSTAVELLEQLNAPLYKIASFEIVDLPLIRRTAATGKPIIISTGLANLEEIGEAVVAARDGGASGVMLLHCISGYPTPAKDSNLQQIGFLAKHFDCPIGLSDHTLGVDVSVAAVALGACVIEKHFTLKRADGGPDAEFSLEPEELVGLVKGARTAFEAKGTSNYGRAGSESGNVIFRRSLYVVQDIAPGEPFTHENIRSIRPGYGMAPKYLPDVLGRAATMDLLRGMPLQHNMVNFE